MVFSFENKNEYISIDAASIDNSSLPSTGFLSDIIPYEGYSTLNIQVNSNKNITLKIRTFHTQQTSNAGVAPTGKLVFEHEIAADENYFKRFAVRGAYFQIEIVNRDAVAGTIHLYTGVSVSAQFAAETLLNSQVGIDADVNLVRNANDWNVDMVRGIHTEFTKVNIKGLLEASNPNTTRTVGLQDYNFVVDVADDLYIYHPNANDDSAGTGARSVRIQYVDENDALASLDYTITGGGGSNFPLFVRGKAVHRVFVLTTGSGKANAGQITITNAGQTAIYNSIEAGANASQGAVFLTPSNRQMVLQDVNIAATGMSGKIRVIERDYANGINYSLGDFKINSNYQQLTYTLNTLVPAGNMILVNYIPDGGAAAVDTLINVNINGVLAPLVDSF